MCSLFLPNKTNWNVYLSFAPLPPYSSLNTSKGICALVTLNELFAPPDKGPKCHYIYPGLPQPGHHVML